MVMRPGEDELVRIFGVHAALDGVALELDLALRERQLLAGSDHDLGAHDVDARDQLGDRVLHLHAGVHLDEVELAVLVQELEGARATVADLLAGRGAALADLLDQAAECREPALPRSPSGGGAAWSSRARPGRRRCLCVSASTWISTWRGFCRNFPCRRPDCRRRRRLRPWSSARH
jgi:hypothetical protein